MQTWLDPRTVGSRFIVLVFHFILQKFVYTSELLNRYNPRNRHDTNREEGELLESVYWSCPSDVSLRFKGKSFCWAKIKCDFIALQTFNNDNCTTMTDSSWHGLVIRFTTPIAPLYDQPYIMVTTHEYTYRYMTC